jgi:DNA-binding transcriptional LysR family regulator
MDVRDLKVFAAVADAGVVTRAATRLNTVQSNVTARLHALEQELGVPLFIRHSRGMSLTAAGTHLQPYATKILALVDEAKNAVSDNGEPKGILRLGSMETTAAVRIPPLLISFTKRFPLIDMNFYTGTTDELVQDVLDRKLDGAFVAGPISHRDLETVVAYEEELTIATSKQVLSLDQLITSSDELRILVFRKGCAYRRRLEGLLNKRGVAKVKVLEFGTLEGIVGCVAAGLGVTLLPTSVARSSANLACHALCTDDARIETVFISHAGDYAHSPVAHFQRHIGERLTAPSLGAVKPARLFAIT